MSSSTTRVLRHTFTAALLAAGVVGLAGCATPAQPQRLPVAETMPQQVDIDFEKGVNRPPTPKTLYVMAKLYVGQGRDDEAERLLLKVLAENPKFVPAYCDLAEVMVRHRRPDE